uniref:Uncharacterized protein n=1 Tax=Picea glauca TaxID=3330 RepID=A0A117NJ79_PICGL|nr:hypothetical protein ABT39_MTgene896 [Picea glauca]
MRQVLHPLISHMNKGRASLREQVIRQVMRQVLQLVGLAITGTSNY